MLARGWLARHNRGQLDETIIWDRGANVAVHSLSDQTAGGVRANMNALEVGVNSHAILQMVWRPILLSTTPKRSIFIVVRERQVVGDVGALTTTT